MDMAMARVDASQLSPQDRQELDRFNEARRKQRAAGAMKAAALDGVAIPPDPTQPPSQQVTQEQGPVLTTPGQINMSQQEEIDAADLLRKHEMEKHMAAVRAGRNPSAVGSTIDLVHLGSIPGEAAIPQAAAAVSGVFSVWRAIRQYEDQRKMSDRKTVYADEWSALRDMLKEAENGDWVAIHYQFPATVKDVLGFFDELDSPYKLTVDAVLEKFDVIVKGSRIFRSEIEAEKPEAEKPEAEPAEPEAAEKT